MRSLPWDRTACVAQANARAVRRGGHTAFLQQTTMKLSPDKCEVCNSELFEVVPFKTTQREIVEFAQHSSLPPSERESIIQHRWIHPGLHCPNGCTKIFVEYGQIPLPTMTTSESIAIAQTYSREHHREFVKTHGFTSRIVACIHCANFDGAVVEGQARTALYSNPKYRPLREKQGYLGTVQGGPYSSIG